MSANEEHRNVYSDPKQELRILAKPTSGQNGAAPPKQQLASVQWKWWVDSQPFTFGKFQCYSVNRLQQQQQKQ